MVSRTVFVIPDWLSVRIPWLVDIDACAVSSFVFYIAPLIVSRSRARHESVLTCGGSDRERQPVIVFCERKTATTSPWSGFMLSAFLSTGPSCMLFKGSGSPSRSPVIISSGS